MFIKESIQLFDMITNNLLCKSKDSAKSLKLCFPLNKINVFYQIQSKGKVSDFEVVIFGFQPILFKHIYFIYQSETEKHILKVGDFAKQTR